MNLAETNDLLCLIARYDNRRFDDATVVAWRQLLADLDLADCQRAVLDHFATSDAYLMPVHIVRRVAELADERVRIAARAKRELSAEPEPVTDSRPLQDRAPEIRDFVNRVRDMLPEGSLEALHPRAMFWEREHRAYQRQQNAEPNPLYDPKRAKPIEWQRAKVPASGEWWEDERARELHCRQLLADAGRLYPPDEEPESELPEESA